jgi:hypothetical protein
MRLLISLIVALATSAVALTVAALVLSGFSISVLDFPIVVIIFAAILVVARAATETIVDKHAHIVSSFVGLIGAFIALGITNAVSSGLTIHGIGTWIWASIIVWLGMIIANLLLGRWIFRKLTGRPTVGER